MEVHGTVRSVGKALGLLEILLSRRSPLSLQELSAAAGLPKSTAHALLSTLREHAMVEQRPDGRYSLGIRLFECGCAVSASWDISRLAQPHLDQLSAETGASSFVSLLDGGNVISFAQCTGSGGMPVVPEVGYRLPLHATSQGKLLLAQRSDAEVQSLMESAGMAAFTPHTFTDPAPLLAALSAIRQQGYAVEDGEYKIGLRSVSAPVRDSGGLVRYALGVVGLFRRTRSPEFEAAVEAVCRHARQLSVALGYRQSQELFRNFSKKNSNP